MYPTIPMNDIFIKELSVIIFYNVNISLNKKTTDNVTELLLFN